MSYIFIKITKRLILHINHTFYVYIFFLYFTDLYRIQIYEKIF